MSTSTTAGATTQRWLSAEQMRAMGFTPTAPEIDYGTTWGERHDVRVFFAPHRDRDDGYLYAHDPSTDRYLILAAHTTPAQVEDVWRELLERTASPDGYLALAVLDHGEDELMRPDQARALLWHCLGRELDARRRFTLALPAGRPEAASAVVIERSARVGAQRLLLGTLARHTADAGPVVVRYRMLGDPDWTGRLAAASLPAAAREARQLLDLARERGFEPQATSVTQNWTTRSAARVPELAFAAARPLTIAVPSAGI